MLKVLTLPNPKLRLKAKLVTKIDKRVEKIIAEMKVFLEKSESPKGIGLAAPQLGISSRIILVRFENIIVPFINPEIINTEREITEGFEGCLSVPGIYGFVERPAIVTVRAITNYRFNSRGIPTSSLTSPFILHTSYFDSLPARVILHEIDHLNGILFVDRILEQKARLLSSGAKATDRQGKFYRVTGKDKEGKDILEEVSL